MDSGPETVEELLLGREPELACIDDFWSGDAPALVLGGEAGIGKTTLLRTAVARGADRGWSVLSAAPARAETDLPYAVLGDLLGGALQGPEIGTVPVPQRRALEIVLLLEPATGSPPDPRAVALATTATLRALAEQGPVAVVVDDAQWMDRASADALAFALRRLPSDRVRALFAVRSGHEPPPPATARDAVRLAVGPLSFGAGHRLLGHMLDGGATHAVARRLHESAHGNPLHLLELARALDRRWPWTPDSVVPPPDLTALVGQRVARLPDGAREALAYISAMSRPTVDLLASVRGDAVHQELRDCTESGLLRVEGDRLRFTHPLYATACYHAEPSARRRVLHARLADVVEDPERRARHLALSVAGTDTAVARALDEGAASARARGAPHAAAELSELARALTPATDEAALFRRTRELAQSLLEAGESAHARATLEQLMSGQEPGPERARTLVALSAVLFEEDGVAAMRSAASQALDEAGDDDAVAAEAHLVLAERAEFPAEQSLYHAEQSLAFLEQAPDPDPGRLAHALRELAIARWQQGRGMSRDLMERATRLESELAWPPPVAWRARTCMAECLKYLDCFEEADRLLAECEECAEREGDLSSMSDLEAHRAELSLWLGRWDEAATYADRGVESARLSEQRGRARIALYVRSLVHAHRGLADAAREDATGVLDMGLETDDRWCVALARTSLAFQALSESDPATAVAQLREVDAFCEEAVLAEPRQWRYLGDYVEALVRCDELDTARDRLDRLRRWAEGMGTAPAHAAWLRARGLVAEVAGGDEDAVTLLAEAATAYDDLPLPFERARTLLLLGGAQRRARRRRDARQSLERALAGFDALGAPTWAARARAELDRISGRAGNDRELTASEAKVADLVARGFSNKQVAATLVITPRTVEAHLTRIYAKLGVRSRVELVRRSENG